MKSAKDIQSLSTFKRDTARVMKQLKKTKEPVVLTVKGKPALVIQDAESYQELWEAKQRMRAIEAIKNGLADIKKGKGTPLDEFFTEFFAKNNIPQE